MFGQYLSVLAEACHNRGDFGRRSEPTSAKIQAPYPNLAPWTVLVRGYQVSHRTGVQRSRLASIHLLMLLFKHGL